MTSQFFLLSRPPSSGRGRARRAGVGNQWSVVGARLVSETAGVLTFIGDRSFAALRMTAGVMLLFTPAGRLYGFLNTKREMAYVSHSSFITRHPERSRRIYSAIAVYLATDSVAFLLFHQQGTCSNLLRQFLGFTAIAV